MRKSVLTLVLIMFLFSWVGTCTALADNLAGVTEAIVFNPNPQDRLNLRIKPDKESESLGKYYSGTRVEILESVNEQWVRVRIGFIDSGYLEGFMLTDFLVNPTGENTVEPAFPMMRCMKEDFFCLSTKPDDTSPKVQHYDPNDVIFSLNMPITVLGDLPNGWCHVSIEGNDWANPRADKNGDVNFTGFIKRDLLSPLSDHLGIVSNASIEYDSNPQHPFTKAELNAAVAVIKDQFALSYVGCDLIRLWYDEAESDAYISNEPNMELSPEYIVFLSDFNVVTGYAATGFETGHTVSDWMWYLRRTDSNSEWEVIGWGLY